MTPTGATGPTTHAATAAVARLSGGLNSFAHLFSGGVPHDIAVLGLGAAIATTGGAVVAGGAIGLRRLYNQTVVRRWALDNAAHFEFIPKGDRPTELTGPAQTMKSALDTLANESPRRGRVAFNWWTDGEIVHSGITVIGVPHAASLAGAIARSIGASLRELATSPLPHTRHLAWASRKNFVGFGNLTTAMQQSQQSPILDALARQTGSLLAEASGPAFLSITAKPLSNSERERLCDWLDSYLRGASGLAGATTVGWNQYTVLCRGLALAGAQSEATARRLTFVGPFLPEFESGLRAHVASDRSPACFVTLPLTALGLSIAWLTKYVNRGSHLHHMAGLEHLGLAIAGIGVVATLVALTNVLRVAFRSARRWTDVGAAPIPFRPFTSLLSGWHGGATRSGMEDHEQLKDRRQTKRTLHPYVCIRRLLVFTPPHLAVASALLPASSTNTEATTSLMLAAPIAARTAHGSRIGYDPEGWGVQIPETNRTGGVVVIGDPGQGKSTALLSVFAGDLMSRADEWRKERELRRALIWLETKGEGASRALEVAGQVGYDWRANHICFLDATADSGPQLSLVDWSNPAASAALLAEAMRAAWRDRAILDDSEETLNVVLELALVAVATEGLLEQAHMPGYSFMQVAHVLSFGDPSTHLRERLLACIYKRLGMTEPTSGGKKATLNDVVNGGGPEEGIDLLPGGDSPLGIALRKYKSKYRIRAADTEQVFSPPKNKFHKLLQAGTFWTANTGRPQVSFRTILEQRMAVVINFGGERRFSDELRPVLGAMSTYVLWDAITRVCDDWDVTGKSVALFSDELTHITGIGNERTADIIQLMRDNGRSYGVRLVLATQRFAQLQERPETLSAIKSFDTKVYLRQNGVDEAEMAARDLVGDEDGSFTANDVRRLGSLRGLVRMRVGDVLTPPFSLEVALPDRLTTAALRADSRQPITDQEEVEVA